MKKPCLSRYQKQKLEKNRNDKKITIKLGNKMNESVDNKKNDNKLDTNQSQLDTEAITSGETPSSGTPSLSNKPEEANPPLGEVVGEVPAKVVIDENGEEGEGIWKKINTLRSKFKDYFFADAKDNEENMRKQRRLSILALACIAVVFAIIASLGEITGKAKSPKVNEKEKSEYEVEKLAKGVTNEKYWSETAQKEVDAIASKQEVLENENKKITKEVLKNALDKTEMENRISAMKKELEEEMMVKMKNEINTLKIEKEQDKQNTATKSSLMVDEVPKKKEYKFGKYIPAGSHAKATLISGVDAGIGISSEADPRHVLMRVTGAVTSAGIGIDNLTSNVLVGCLIQAQAVGDISSEKAYLKPVLMTCAKKGGVVIELPVKGYVISQGKSGIRGEIISREGDLVLKSFLSGAIGGIGGGVSQNMQPKFKLKSGEMVGERQGLKDIFAGGIGGGVGTSSEKLSDYFITKAEQYQPVISIDEGITVDVVFQEGFSLEAQEDGK